MAGTELEHCLRLVITNDKTEAILHIEPDTDPSLLDVDSIRIFLDTRDIGNSKIIDGAIETLIERALEEPTLGHDGTVAAGKPPEHGEDGGFSFAPDINAQFQRIKERRSRETPPPQPTETDDHDEFEDGIDHYNSSAFVIVRPGDLLGEIAEPTDGTDGIDIFGGNIPAKPGKRADISFDDLTIATDRHGRATARIAGQLEFTGTKLSINRELVIEDSVDFRTGNIDFPGDVCVKKGVRDCFVVRATGDIRIGDLVEAATLDADGSIELAGGMAAREKGTVRSGRDFSARYLDNVTATINGCMSIDREINSCSITVGKRIESPALVIRGGETNCMQRADVGQIGGEGEVKSSIILGKLPDHDDLIRRVAETIPALCKAASEAQSELQQLQDNVAKLTPQQAETLTELQFIAMDRASKRDTLTGLFDRLTRGISKLVRTSLTVRRAVFPGTTVWVPGYRIEFHAEMRGPFVLDLDEDGKPQARDLQSDSIKSLTGFAKITPDDRVMPIQMLRETVLKAA
jgi:uncharacterized protein (DUF342 family)